jgi:copper chaperone CopZ
MKPLMMRHVLQIGCVVALVIVGMATAAPQAFKHQITGLCCKEREADLRETFERMDGVKLVAIDFENAEVALEYDAALLFARMKPEQMLQALDNLVKKASNHTFGIKPLRTTPREKLQRIEIPVAGLDCKACSLAAYEAIYKLDGVEMATASFREGRVTALVDPIRIDRAKLETALKKKNVDLPQR